MSADRVLMLKLLGDTSSIDKSLRKTEGRLKGMGRAGLAWGKAFALNLAIEGVDKLTEAIGDAWTGFREGEKAGAQLATTWKNLGLDGSKLSGTIDAISASTLKLGTDDTEAIMAFNEALKTTGGDSKKAMDRLRIAQDLVANGSAPDLTSALAIIRGAAKGSSKVVDKFGLTADTAAGRVRELRDKVKGAAKHARDLDPLGAASNAIGEGLETIVGALSKGDLDKAAEGITAIALALGTFGDDIAPGVTTALDKLSDGGWSKFTDWVSTTFTPVIDDLSEAIRTMGVLWDELKPHIDNALTFLQPLLDKLSPSIAGGLGLVLDTVKGTLQLLTDLLKGDFSGALDTVTGTLATLGSDLDSFLFGIPGKLTNIAGDVLKAAQTVGNNIFNGIVSGVRRMASVVVDVWNSLGTFPAGGFTFAEAFDIEIMGQHIGWPKIAINWGAGDIIPNIGGFSSGGSKPQQHGNYAKGLWDVPHDMTATIHKGEQVVPADFASEYRRNGGMGGNTYAITVNVAPGGDLAEAGRQMVRAIKQFERTDGRAWRTGT